MRGAVRLGRILVAASLLVAAPAAAQAQRTRVDARISPASGQVGDVVVVDVTILTPGAAPTAIDVPALPAGLRLTGSSEFTEYEFRLPGGRQRTTRRELTITTVAPGHYVIPPIAVRVGGATYRSRPLRLDIAPAYAATPPGSGNPAVGPGDDVLLQSWATPDTVFVGQQVTVRADALFSTDVRGRLAGAPQYDAPSAPGFWVYDLPSNAAPQLRPVHGRVYEAQTFRRAFFPLSPGRLVVPGAHLSYAVRRGFLSGPEYYDLRGDPLPVVVRPLPADGRPAGFSGAVGRYTASARVQPASVGAGEAATLTLEVAGEGNIKAVAPPRLPALSGVEVFAPAEDSDIKPDDEAVGGMKRFSWVLVPSKPGQLVIPALELPYFDPGQRRYAVARTDPLELTVAPTPLASGASGNIAPGGVSLRPLRERDDGAGAAPWVRSDAFLALQALPLVAFLAVVVQRKRRRARPVVRPRGGPVMLERLRAEIRTLRARAAEGEPGSEGAAPAPVPDAGTAAAEGAAAALPERAGAAPGGLPGQLLAFMREWLAERLGEPGLVDIPIARLDPVLREAGVRATVAAGIAALAGRLEQARYMPEPLTPRECLIRIDEAERLLAEVHVGARRRGRGRLGIALLAAGAASAAGAGRATALTAGDAAPIAVAASTPADARAAADAAFARAVAAYNARQFARAADLFAAYTDVHPDHAAAWYDLGNAAYRAGQRGRATWAWLRAVELRPRDPDIRQNLALAGTDPAIVDSVAPPVFASLDELLLAAGLAWLVGASALLARRLSSRRALAVTGGVAVVVAALCAGFAGITLLGPPRAIALHNASLLGAPNEHADSLGAVSEGAAVRVLEERPGWLQVRAGGEKDGWIEESGVGRL